MLSTALIVVAGVLLSNAGMIWVRRRIPPEKLAENNAYVAFTFSILSLIYGIYLAFTVVVVWQQYEVAEEQVTAEVVLLNTLWRNVETFPPEDRRRIHQHLIQYTRDVIEKDWPRMEYGTWNQRSPMGTALWNDLYRVQLDPNDLRQQAFFSETLTRMNEFTMARRMRILASTAALPTSMWVLLIVGAVGTIMFTWFYGTHYVSIQIAATSFLSAVIIFSVLLVSMLEHPFGGGIAVGPGGYQEMLETFEERYRTEAKP